MGSEISHVDVLPKPLQVVLHEDAELSSTVRLRVPDDFSDPSHPVRRECGVPFIEVRAFDRLARARALDGK